LALALINAIGFATYQSHKPSLKRRLVALAANYLSARKQESNSNQEILPAKRKIAAQQLRDCANQKKNYGVAIGGLRLPKEKSQHGN
jgi:hypothetical protein